MSYFSTKIFSETHFSELFSRYYKQKVVKQVAMLVHFEILEQIPRTAHERKHCPLRFVRKCLGSWCWLNQMSSITKWHHPLSVQCWEQGISSPAVNKNTLCISTITTRVMKTWQKDMSVVKQWLCPASKLCSMPALWISLKSSRWR